MMLPFPLLDLAERVQSDASLEVWYERILPTLNQREIAVFTAVHGYLKATGYADVTGAELAAYMGLPVTSVRPRTHGLQRKGWLLSGALRPSRVAFEARCHPYWPAVPLAAVTRGKS